jgi:hypothetical protein
MHISRAVAEQSRGRENGFTARSEKDAKLAQK